MSLAAACTDASTAGLTATRLSATGDALVPCAEDGPLTWLLQTRGRSLCAHAPVGTLGAFLYTLLGRLEVGHGLLVVALSYLRRLPPAPLVQWAAGRQAGLHCGHCAVVGCLVLAAKYLEDNHRPTYATWAQAAHVSRATLQTLELATLQVLGYSLHLHPTDFRTLCRAYERDRVVRSWHYVSRLGLPTGTIQGAAPTPPPTPPYTPPLDVPGTPTPPALAHGNSVGLGLKRPHIEDGSNVQHRKAPAHRHTGTAPWMLQGGTQY